MATVDQWETQEGYICQGNVIGFVELGAPLVAGEPLQWDTPVANKIVMKKCAAAADSCAVSLKGGTTGDKIPAVFYGVVKMCAHSAITVGDPVVNAKTVGATITYGQVTPLTAAATTDATHGFYLKHNSGTGTAYILGLALQAATTVGNELLILVGGFR